MPYRIWFRKNKCIELPKPESYVQRFEIKIPWFTRQIEIEVPADPGRLSPHHVNQKVIVKGANNEPYWIGTVTDTDAIRKTSKPIPRVQDEYGKEWICFGIVRDYSESLIAALDKLNPVEQWNVMAQNYMLPDDWRGQENIICD